MKEAPFVVTLMRTAQADEAEALTNLAHTAKACRAMRKMIFSAGGRN